MDGTGAVLAGEGERAHWLFSMLNPISHGASPAQVKRYRVEPYVLAGDVYASAQHLGRGGWSWYNGLGRLDVPDRGREHVGPDAPRQHAHDLAVRSARLAKLLGYLPLRKERPDRGFQNPDGVATGVQSVELDGRALPQAELVLVDDGRHHRALVVMGRARAAASLPSASTIKHARSAE